MGIERLSIRERMRAIICVRIKIFGECMPNPIFSRFLRTRES